MSIGIVALCFCLHQVVWRTDFVQFYITLCRESRKIVLEPTEDVGLVIINYSYLLQFNVGLLNTLCIVYVAVVCIFPVSTPLQIKPWV